MLCSETSSELIFSIKKKKRYLEIKEIMIQFQMQSTSKLKYKCLDEEHLKNIIIQNKRLKERKALKLLSHYWLVLHFLELIFNEFSWRVRAGYFEFA